MSKYVLDVELRYLYFNEEGYSAYAARKFAAGIFSSKEDAEVERRSLIKLCYGSHVRCDIVIREFVDNAVIRIYNALEESNKYHKIK